MTAVEWADQHFQLSPESSYSETIGQWTTLPFQIAPLNMMGNDDIAEFNFIKSARVGYTKLLLAAIAYFIVHKRRNGMLWQPTDDASDEFTKEHVEPMIRDVRPMRKLFPWLGKRHRFNTLDYKKFLNSRQLHIKGGKSAKNYREKSVSFVMYDELSSFDPDIEKEGAPTLLGDKRTDGAAFPKSIRGSTPKVAGECQIEIAASEAGQHFERYVPCPHCGHEQRLRWGGEDTGFGLKFERDEENDEEPTAVWYVCEGAGCVIENKSLLAMDREGYWRSQKGVTTVDGIDFYDADGHQVAAPRTVSVHIWAAYNSLSSWSRIVRDFLKCKNRPTKLKTWVNTTLGETWEETVRKHKPEDLFLRRENYAAPVPRGVIALTAGVDVQDDRIEVSVYGFGGTDGARTWLIDHVSFIGDPGKAELWKRVSEFLDTKFEHESGIRIGIAAAAVDTGGHYTQEAYKFCKRRERKRTYAIKGSNQRGAPLAGRPNKAKIRGGATTVRLYPVGTDTAKDTIFSRLDEVDNTSPDYISFPTGRSGVDIEFFEQLLSEKKKTVRKSGNPVRVYVKTRNRNEALDCLVYAVAALDILRPNLRLISQRIESASGQELGEMPESESTPKKKRLVRKKRRPLRRRKNFATDW